MIVLSIILAITIIVLCMKLHHTLKVDLEASYYKGWTDCERLAVSYAALYGYDLAKVKEEIFKASKVEMWEPLERSK